MQIANKSLSQEIRRADGSRVHVPAGISKFSFFCSRSKAKGGSAEWGHHFRAIHESRRTDPIFVVLVCRHTGETLVDLNLVRLLNRVMAHNPGMSIRDATTEVRAIETERLEKIWPIKKENVELKACTHQVGPGAYKTFVGRKVFNVYHKAAAGEYVSGTRFKSTSLDGLEAQLVHYVESIEE